MLTVSKDEGVTEWENPQTGEIFLINNRTGHSQLASGMRMVPLGKDFRVIDKSSLSNEPPTSSVEQPDWIKGILTVCSINRSFAVKVLT
jgi:hypothetical protein